MATPAIFADFNNADALGRVRLNTVGTVEDLGRFGVRLADGLRLTVVDGDDDLEADGEVLYSTAEGIWVARIDWNAIRHIFRPS